MAVSIVSKPYGDDNNQTPTNILSSTEENISPLAGEDVVVGEAVHTAQDAAVAAMQEAVTPSNDDSQRLNDLHPENVTVPVLDEVKNTAEPLPIPNMYIQADIKDMNPPTDVPTDVAIFSQEPQQEDAGGFDMDDLLDDTASLATTEQAIVAPVAQEIIELPKSAPAPIASSDPLVKETSQSTNIQQKQEIKKPVLTPKKSLTKSLAMAAAGLFGVVVIGFVLITMFPVGIDGSTVSNTMDEDLLIQEPIVQEPSPEEDHASAEAKTPQQIAREELVNYSKLGEEYYTLGRDLKDRNMVRYALYVEKKAKDLIDLLDLDPNMDTKDVVVYFAQFDDYLKTLADWKAGLGDITPTGGSNAIIEEDMFVPSQDPFIDTQTTADDTSTGSTQSGTSLTEPEQSELSDG